MTPFFSIITCTRNSQKYLSQNLASLSFQTFRDFEHIFVDGKSSDTTLKLLKSYQHKFPKQVKIFSYPPQGISHAMNTGLRRACGEYLLFLHSDDKLADPSALEFAAGYLKSHPSLDWIYGQIRTIEAKGQPVGIFPRQKIFQINNSYLLKFFNFIPHQAVFMKKDVFTHFGYFNTALSSAMDYDLWLRISRFTQWRFLPVIVSDFRLHSLAQTSGSTRVLENNRNFNLVIHKHLSLFEYLVSKNIDKFIHKLKKLHR